MRRCFLFLLMSVVIFLFTWVTLWGVFILAVETLVDHRTCFVFGLLGLVYIVSMQKRLLGWLYKRYLEKL